ncbi:50S ribosomal protein L9 [Planctomycetota bacterium]
MELLLKENVEHLGEMGEIVDVSPGYARNFLIPKGLAEKLTPAAMRRVESLKRKLEEHKAAQRQQMSVMLKEIEGRESFTIIAEADENGHLYGSVTEVMVADMLKDEGFELDKKHIIIEDPIKTCDIFSVAIKIGEEDAAFKLWVVAK